jgi:hypothetical protein
MVLRAYVIVCTNQVLLNIMFGCMFKHTCVDIRRNVRALGIPNRRRSSTQHKSRVFMNHRTRKKAHA